MNLIRRGWILVVMTSLICGCASVNKTLDKTNEAVYKASEPVGKIMKIPQSAAEGAAAGVAGGEEDNPFNR